MGRGGWLGYGCTSRLRLSEVIRANCRTRNPLFVLVDREWYWNLNHGIVCFVNHPASFLEITQHPATLSVGFNPAVIGLLPPSVGSNANARILFLALSTLSSCASLYYGATAAPAFRYQKRCYSLPRRRNRLPRAFQSAGRRRYVCGEVTH